MSLHAFKISRAQLSVALVSLTIGAMSLSGCRLGNYTDEGNGKDQVSGYYETLPVKLVMCAGVSGSVSCGDVTGQSSVPSFISSILTNPTWLLLADPKENIAYLTPPGGQGRYLPVRVGDHGSMVLPTSSTDPVQARNDPSCARYKEVTINGRFDRTSGPFDTQTEYTPVGRLSFQIQVLDLFVPTCDTCSCSATMSEFQSCYQDASLCGGSSSAANSVLQSRARDIFDTYVHAGLITADQISGVSGFSYTVDYQ